MSYRLARTTAPEHGTTAWHWLPLPDDGADGGAGADAGSEGDAGTDDDADDADDDSDGLGDAGKQALDRMKNRARTAERELRDFKRLGLTVEQIRALQGAGKGDQAPDADAIREEARREARAETLRERVTDKIEARAAKGFADPEDAVAILLRTHDADDFLDGDKIDAEAIQDALDELLKKKPHLAAQGGKRFGGSGDGGKRQEKKPDPGPGLARLRDAYSTT